MLWRIVTSSVRSAGTFGRFGTWSSGGNAAAHVETARYAAVRDALIAGRRAEALIVLVGLLAVAEPGVGQRQES